MKLTFVVRGNSRALRRRDRRAGIALVAVMLAIAITLVISNDFGTSTTIDTIDAANYRDQVTAHFLARSALNLGELLIRIQSRLDNNKATRGQFQVTDFANQIMGAFCGSAGEIEATLGLPSQLTKGLGADVGTCGFDGPITTEDNKLNVNCANVSGVVEGRVNSMLQALMYFPAYDYVFDDNAADGWHRDRQTQAYAIVDYVDTDTMQGSQRGTSEDYQYEASKDPYYAKNNYIDTTGELRLVRGVDDRWWTLFGGALTAYGTCRLNLPTLDNTMLIAAVLFMAAKNPNDPVIMDPKRLFLLASYVAKAKEFGITFQKTSDFVKFVADPGADVQGIAKADMGTAAGSAAASALISGLPGLEAGQQIGLALDQAKLTTIAQVNPRRTFVIHAYGEVERGAGGQSPMFPAIRSTYTGIWDTKIVPQNVRKPPMPNGAWVFLKEE